MNSVSVPSDQDELVAHIISHDACGQLNHFRSFLTLLGRDLPEGVGPSVHHDLDMLRHCTGRLTAVLNGLVTYLRVPHEVGEHPVSLTVVMETVRHHCEKAYPKLHISWQIAALPTVLSDQSAMVLLLEQLCLNSIIFNTSERPTVDISCEASNDGRCIRVSDNGIGLDPRLFDRAVQLGERCCSDHMHPGAGMGLAIANKIVSLMSGHLTLQNHSDGHGLSVDIWLPEERFDG